MFRAFGNFLHRTPWWALVLVGFLTLALLGLFVTPFHVIKLQKSGSTPEQNRAIKREIDVSFGQSALGVAEEVVRALQRSSKDPVRVAEFDRALLEIDRARREIQAEIGNAGSVSSTAANEARQVARGAALEAAQESYDAAVEAREAVAESQQELRRKLNEAKIPTSEWPKSLERDLQRAKKAEDKAQRRLEKARDRLADHRLSIGIGIGADKSGPEIASSQQTDAAAPAPAEPPPIPEADKAELTPPAPPVPPAPSRLPNELRRDIHSKVASDLVRIGVGSVVILLFIPLFIVALIAKYFIGRARRMQELAELKKKEAEVHNFSRQITEAKLQALQAQVEPHFLYNTLANVQALTEVDPAAANAMVGNLIQYLRASLPKMRETGSTVGQEVERVEAFLNILKMRMGERLEFSIDVAEDAKSRSFPPMILPTLVENAIKHGLEPLREGGRIDILARVENDRLLVIVKDNGRGLGGGSDAVGGGVGLSNIRERLAALFGGAARMSLVENSPRGVIASIDLPMGSAASTSSSYADAAASASADTRHGKAEPAATGAAAKAWAAVKKTHSVWGNIISFTFTALMIVLAVAFGAALAALLAGVLPVEIDGIPLHLEGFQGLAVGSMGLLVGFGVAALAIAIVVAVIYGLGVLFAGLLIFIPVVILIAIFPALSPFILLGLLIYWLVRRSRKRDLPS